MKFIANSRATGTGTWIKKSAMASWRSWSGFAFERLCLAHIPQIKSALGISGIYTEESSWRKTRTAKAAGTQIDLLIERGDNSINICEIKFSEDEFIVTKKYADELRAKLSIFRQESKSRKTLFLTLISTFGLSKNKYSTSLVQQSIDANALFKAE